MLKSGLDLGPCPLCGMGTSLKTKGGVATYSVLHKLTCPRHLAIQAGAKPKRPPRSRPICHCDGGIGHPEGLGCGP